MIYQAFDYYETFYDFALSLMELSSSFSGKRMPSYFNITGADNIHFSEVFCSAYKD